MSITLPPEVLQGCTPHLSRYNLTVCVRVCQGWHSAFNPYLWKDVVLDYIKSRTKKSKAFQRGVEAGALLRSITSLYLGSAPILMDNKEYDYTHILRLFKLCPQLRSLNLSDDMLSRRNPIVQDLIAAIPATVETLDLTVCRIDYEVVERELPGGRGDTARIPRPQPLIPFLPRLTTLNISKFVGVTSSSWSLMFKNCPQLETLRLDRVHLLGASSAISLAARQFCPRLAHCTVYCDKEKALMSKALATFLTASVGGWERIYITAQFDYSFQFGPDCTDVLLRNGSRLKSLVLKCHITMSLECVRKLNLMLPNLVISA
ncbi:hypothetical protein BGZ95_000345 [Linnemannia exigua]|uniref:F-box domain-containing protein n=1 Tax=Linnemannia exigua TaxID=604196 RepID=A0AAD4H905_9FUNG|nr:hypothetical protein BGZ95_000345 [Linnemannia exigua]